MSRLCHTVRFKLFAVLQGARHRHVFPIFFVPVLVLAFGAQAAGTNPSVEDYSIFVSENTNVFLSILTYASFVLGIILGALGVDDIRKSVENPQTPIKNGLSKLVFGGIFLAFPFMVDIALSTMGGYDFDPMALVLRNKFFFSDKVIKSGALSGLVANSINNVTVLVNVAAFAAFLIGAWFVLRGLQMLRTHVENPSNAPLPEALKRLAVGGALLSLPMIVNIVFETFGAFGAVVTNKGFDVSATGGGLDGLMVNFIKDIANPAYLAIEVFCYISGVLLVLFAMQRMVKTAQDGPNGPLGFGTIATFIVAGLLLSFPQLLANVTSSIFGSSTALTKVEFMSLSGAVDDSQVRNAKNVFSAVLAFMAVIGFLSVVRGLFLLRAFAQGNSQATMMSIVTHIVAGALCVNLGGFINAVQASLGLTGADVPVTFK